MSSNSGVGEEFHSTWLLRLLYHWYMICLGFHPCGIPWGVILNLKNRWLGILKMTNFQQIWAIFVNKSQKLSLEKIFQQNSRETSPSKLVFQISRLFACTKPCAGRGVGERFWATPEKTPLFSVGLYNPQFQGTILLMVFDLQRYLVFRKPPLPEKQKLLRDHSSSEPWVLPRKLTWNPKMKVWKLSFLSNGVNFRFHVSFGGST